jgi:hypothetical protein
MEAFLLGGFIGFLLYVAYGEVILFALRYLATMTILSAIVTFIDSKVSAKYK